jgi:hypothetical protein
VEPGGYPDPVTDAATRSYAKTLIPVVMCDIDGTLANNEARWKRFIGPAMKRSSPESRDAAWVAYDLACEMDPPIAAMIEVVRALSMSYDIVMMTGRKNIAAEQTIAWLDRYGIDYSDLLMRTPEDRQTNAGLKLVMLDEVTRVMNRRVDLAIDDHPGVVKAFQGKGIPTLLVNRPTSPHG